jgi:hypothetical protein
MGYLVKGEKWGTTAWWGTFDDKEYAEWLAEQVGGEVWEEKENDQLDMDSYQFAGGRLCRFADDRAGRSGPGEIREVGRR